MGLNFDPLSARFASARRVIYGRRGMVCASQPLAAQAGLDILRRGGNAIDAAIAAAACLTVLDGTDWQYALGDASEPLVLKKRE